MVSAPLSSAAAGAAARSGLTAAVSAAPQAKAAAQQTLAATAERLLFSTSTRVRRRRTGINRGFLPRGQRIAAKREVLRYVPLVPKLPQPPTAVVPKAIKPMPPPKARPAAEGAGAGAGAGAAGASKDGVKDSAKRRVAEAQDFLSRLKEFLKQNGPVLVLNFGSLCTLSGFTRSDVLELRALSMTGSLSSVAYFSFMRPLPVVAMGWSAIFALTNAFKIYQILDERSHRVILSDDEEDIFVEHFMPHGVTPKQFKKVVAKADTVTVPKGTAISKQGMTMDTVYLVVKGNTRASSFGRRISAASSTLGNRSARKGGDSGAWIGEIAFLETAWQQEHPPKRKTTPRREDVKLDGATEATQEKPKEVPQAANQRKESKGGAAPAKGVAAAAAATAVTAARKELAPVEQPTSTGRALYTIVAEEECTLLAWSHSDLGELMRGSSDMRSAMTRAMTAAVVGKVVNFTVSRSTGAPTWSTWLDEWKHSGGASVNVRTEKMAEATKVMKEQITKP